MYVRRHGAQRRSMAGSVLAFSRAAGERARRLRRGSGSCCRPRRALGGVELGREGGEQAVDDVLRLGAVGLVGPRLAHQQQPVLAVRLVERVVAPAAGGPARRRAGRPGSRATWSRVGLHERGHAVHRGARPGPSGGGPRRMASCSAVSRVSAPRARGPRDRRSAGTAWACRPRPRARSRPSTPRPARARRTGAGPRRGSRGGCARRRRGAGGSGR